MSLIYKPAGRANEYAEWALNVYKGCAHGCVYCYAAGIAARFKQCKSRLAFHENITVKKTFSLKQLRRDAKRLAPQINSCVLLSFSTDPYQPIESELHLTRQCIEILHAEGISVQILTKDPLRACEDLDILTDSDALATTLTLHTTKNPTTWRTPAILEPGAPIYQDRVAGIKKAYEYGITTWVSLEPVIYPADSLNIIRETFQEVDHYKIGTLNYGHLLGVNNPNTTPEEWHIFYENVTALLEAFGYTRTNARDPEPKTYQIKDSLQKYA